MRVYKLLRQSEWQEAKRAGLFSGSPDDRRDGYIHLSTTAQVRGTYQKHFANEAEAVLVSFDAECLESELKWESSRNGEQFPHLYGVLNLSQATSIAVIRKTPDDTLLFPPEIP